MIRNDESDIFVQEYTDNDNDNDNFSNSNNSNNNKKNYNIIHDEWCDRNFSFSVHTFFFLSCYDMYEQRSRARIAPDSHMAPRTSRQQVVWCEKRRVPKVFFASLQDSSFQDVAYPRTLKLIDHLMPHTDIFFSHTDPSSVSYIPYIKLTK